MKRINNNTVQLMKGNNKLIGRLMAHFNKSSLTINRMIDSRHIQLSTGLPLSIIQEETGLKASQILEKEPVPAGSTD